MSEELSETQNLDRCIIQIIKNSGPETVKDLLKLAQTKCLMPEKSILERILYLQQQRQITFEPRSSPPHAAFVHHLFSSEANSYWIIIALSLFTMAFVFLVPENSYPLLYARYVLGSIFVLLLPGYSFIKALFPSKDLGSIERLALSVGLSLALVSIIGLALDYTSFGIKTAPMTLSLVAFNVIFATAAVIREHRTEAKKPAPLAQER